MKFILGALAAWRVSRMIVAETGPFAVFERLRFQVAKHTEPNSWIDQGFNCILCVSFWVALAMAILIGGKNWREILVAWFGIAGGAALIAIVSDP